MPLLGIDLPVTAGGTSQIRVDLEVKRSGSSDDRAQLRVVRREAGYADVVLPSTPQFALPGDRDIRGWTFTDSNLPRTTTVSYILQLAKIAGGGSFYAAAMNGIHFRK